MGDPSCLRLVPASYVSIPIDWTHIPEETKKILLEGWGYDWENEVQRSLPATIGELAKMFDESKFFGYMSAKLCTILMDISELGLKDQPSGVYPRFYMKQLEAVWFILFFPGKRDGITGYSPNIEDDTGMNDEEEQRKETELAQQFDDKLTQETRRVATLHLVNITKKLCGWDASMLQSNLQSAQLMEAIQTLPPDHPAYRTMVEEVMSSVRHR